MRVTVSRFLFGTSPPIRLATFTLVDCDLASTAQFAHQSRYSTTYSAPPSTDHFAAVQHTFVDVGLALAEIRDARLYKAEFHTFEGYCRARWQYGRHYVNRLISAAQVFRTLVTSCHQKPEHESQVRPLIGLTGEQAQQTWEHAAQKAGNRAITPRLLKRAMEELQLTGPAKAAATGRARPNKAAQRRLFDQAIGELLMLLSQQASYAILIEKVEKLHRQVSDLKFQI